MLIVKGPGNVGKSTTVKVAFGLVLKSILRKQKPTSTKFLYLTAREVAGAIQVGPTKVGISTREDNRKEVERALFFFSKEKCKVVVCAIRAKGAPYEAARDFALHKLKIVPAELAKTSESDMSKRALADRAFAKRIRNWATKAIKVA